MTKHKINYAVQRQVSDHGHIKPTAHGAESLAEAMTKMSELVTEPHKLMYVAIFNNRGRQIKCLPGTPLPEEEEEVTQETKENAEVVAE